MGGIFLKIIRKISFFFLIFIFIINIGANNIFADSNGLPFSVEPVLPKNQDEDVSSYISVSPTEESFNQKVEFKLTNQSDREQNVKINIVDAFTSPNGVIQYVQEESENSKIINDKYKLSHYLENDNDIITLKKGETKMISTSLNIDSLEGVLLGGVSFSAIDKAQEQKEEGNSTFQINNEINMVIGAMVSFDTDKDAEFIIGEPFIDPMPSYFAIRLPVTLDAPVLQQNVSIDYQVMYQNKQLFGNQKEFNFAPFTKTNLAIPYEHDEIKENENYTIKGELTYQDQQGNEIVKEFEETFKYEKSKDESTVIKTLKAPIENGKFPLWTILLLIGPVALFVWVIRKKRKKENTETPETLSIKTEE